MELGCLTRVRIVGRLLASPWDYREYLDSRIHMRPLLRCCIAAAALVVLTTGATSCFSLLPDSILIFSMPLPPFNLNIDKPTCNSRLNLRGVSMSNCNIIPTSIKVKVSQSQCSLHNFYKRLLKSINTPDSKGPILRGGKRFRVRRDGVPVC